MIVLRLGCRTVEALGFTPAGDALYASARPAGGAVFFGVGSDVIEWDLAAGRHRRRWTLPLKHVHCLAVAPDGRTAVAGGWHGRLVGFDLD